MNECKAVVAKWVKGQYINLYIAVKARYLRKIKWKVLKTPVNIQKKRIKLFAGWTDSQKLDGEELNIAAIRTNSTVVVLVLMEAVISVDEEFNARRLQPTMTGGNDFMLVWICCQTNGVVSYMTWEYEQ
uniref:DDE_Tnp_1_7 domain-containing protein n=1 Tax=Heterorhabditis bacteriophora TaxID=37862 RepID=A0A1I7XVM9_HETBA